MHEDERDLLEVLIFDEIEETVGTWLRAIIQSLEKEQTAIRRDHRKQRTPAGKKPDTPRGAGGLVSGAASRAVVPLLRRALGRAFVDEFRSCRCYHPRTPG